VYSWDADWVWRIAYHVVIAVDDSVARRTLTGFHEFEPLGCRLEFPQIAHLHGYLSPFCYGLKTLGMTGATALTSLVGITRGKRSPN